MGEREQAALSNGRGQQERTANSASLGGGRYMCVSETPAQQQPTPPCVCVCMCIARPKAWRCVCVCVCVCVSGGGGESAAQERGDEDRIPLVLRQREHLQGGPLA